MDGNIIILLALSTAGFVYFVFIRKVFDFVSCGFFGQIIYFSPGFYGYLANPYYPGILPSVPILDQTYLVWNSCLAATLMTGLLYRGNSGDFPRFRTPATFDFVIIALIVISWGFAAYSTNGIFSSDKAEVLENIDRSFLLFASCCQVSTIAFAIQRKWVRLIVPALGLVFLLYAGFRAEFAISIVAIATYWAREYGILVYLRPKTLFPALLSMIILLGYKPFLTAYRIGNWRVLDQLQMSDNLIDTITLQFEPFLTQAVLNEVLLRHFQVASSTILVALTAAVPFLGPALGIDPIDSSFNFQDYLFPNIPYGITASPQAQFIAAFDFPGLVLFIAILNILLVLCSKGMVAQSPYWRLFALSVGAFLAFYVQRNDLGNSLTIINRMGLTIFVCWLGSWVLTAGRGAPGTGTGHIRASS